MTACTKATLSSQLAQPAGCVPGATAAIGTQQYFDQSAQYFQSAATYATAIKNTAAAGVASACLASVKATSANLTYAKWPCDLASLYVPYIQGCATTLQAKLDGK